MRKDFFVKGNIATKYIEHKHKNTETGCKSICIFKLQCFNSSTKCMLRTVPRISLNLLLDFQLKY